MPEDRTLGETNRRIDSLADEMRAFRTEVMQSFRQMPTADLLDAILKRYDVRLVHIEDDVKEQTARHEQLNAKVDMKIKELSDAADRQRKITTTTAIAVVTLICTIIGTILAIARFV